VKNNVKVARGEVDLQTDFLGFEAEELAHHEDSSCLRCQQIEEGFKYDPELLGLDRFVRTRPSHRTRPITPAASAVEQRFQQFPVFIIVVDQAQKIDSPPRLTKMIDDLVLENREDLCLERRLF